MRLIDADELKEHIGTYDGTTAQVEAVEVQYIDNAPTVDTYTEDDVQYAIKEGHQVGYEMAKAKYSPKTGHWIKDTGIAIKCSECNAMYAISIYDKCYDYLSLDYCPHCGAKMTKEVENEYSNLAKNKGL